MTSFIDTTPATSSSDNKNSLKVRRTQHDRPSTPVVGSRLTSNASAAALASSALDNTIDNLEYFIKFPGFNYGNINGQQQLLNEDVNDGICNEENIPVILILGWAGCQDRYLQKYSAIYEERGLITVRYTAPIGQDEKLNMCDLKFFLETLFWKRSSMDSIGEKILKLIYDMNFDCHPILIHSFSNGGAYLYQHISLAIRKYQRPVFIRGMIFDSAPGERRILGLYRAVSAIYGRDNKRFNCIRAWAITLTLTFMWIVEETYSAFRSLFMKTPPAKLNPFQDLKSEPSEWPQLFLYSKADVVIPYQDIENFANYREQKGFNIVQKVCFEDAEHVKIMMKYPQQYINCCIKFVNDCLSFKEIRNF